jgi:hypothetical protein
MEGDRFPVTMQGSAKCCEKALGDGLTRVIVEDEDRESVAEEVSFVEVPGEGSAEALADFAQDSVGRFGAEVAYEEVQAAEAHQDQASGWMWVVEGRGDVGLEL